MKKSIFAVMFLFLSTNAYSGSPLNELMLNKRKFDDTCNAITQVIANLPECEDCAAAKVAVSRLKMATRKLEQINDYLTFYAPNPEDFDIKEKSAMGIIYQSIKEDAYTVHFTLDKWSKDDSILMNPWVHAAIVAAAIALPLLPDSSLGEICGSVDNEDDCEKIAACHWDIGLNIGRCMSNDDDGP